MIVSVLQMELPPAIREEAMQIIRLYLGPASVQPGCRSSQAFSPLENENALILVEEWDSQEHLDRHLKSEEYRKLLALMEMAKEPPKLRFHTVARTAGMELVQELRGKPGAEISPLS